MHRESQPIADCIEMHGLLDDIGEPIKLGLPLLCKKDELG
jgi:hypothetical protein